MNMICTTMVAMQIYSMPAGPVVTGDVPANEPVSIQDTSLMRDWVFIGRPVFDRQGLYHGSSPRGWVPFAGLANCGGAQ